jgi:hypothetical protein
MMRYAMQLSILAILIALMSQSNILSRLTKVYFSPLIAQVKQRELATLERRWKMIFDFEQGKDNMQYEADTLVFIVRQCPTISI